MPPVHLSRGSSRRKKSTPRLAVAAAGLLLAFLSARRSASLHLKYPQLSSPRVELYPAASEPRDFVKRAVFDRINRDRGAAGLATLAWDEAASRVADDFCQSQVAEKTRGHFLTDGIAPYARTGFAGVFGMQSENALSWITNAPRFSEPIERLALEGHEEMMREKPPADGHRKAVLDREATHVGVGWAAQNGRFQMAQEFLVRGLARLSLSALIGRYAGVLFEGKPMDGRTLAFVTIAREPEPRALSREEASRRTSYAYPTATVSYVPEGRGFIRVSGTMSADRLRIRSDRSFSFKFSPEDSGLYTLIFYLSSRPSAAPRPGGAATLWFE